jgi:hypothetical protein
MTITTDTTISAIKNSKNNKSTGPDNINIQHLKHLGPNAITYLTKIYNIAINKNVIPHTWKLAKIIPIPKPNKDTSIGSSYRPISLLSPISKTLEKIILSIIQPLIPQIAHQHGFKGNHSTVTALHSLTQHITRGFNQKQPPSRTIAIALDMSKAFDTVNLYKLIDKLSKIPIPPTLTKYISNYIKGRKGYTLFNNTTSKQQNFKTGVPQGGVLSPTLFNIYTSDLPTPPTDVHMITYADDITIFSSHHNYKIAEQRIQPFLQQIHDWTIRNNLQLNASKSTATLFTPDPAEYRKTLNLTIDNTTVPTITHPKILGITFDPKLNFNTHIHNTLDKATKTIKILKSLTSTNWGKHKEVLLTTYKTITQPIIEYASTIWSPSLSQTLTNKLQTIQNTALRIATGCTADTNQSHLHTETKMLPIDQHLRLHASQLRLKAQAPTHPLHTHTQPYNPPRLMKQTVFTNRNYTTNIPIEPDQATTETLNRCKKQIHTTITTNYIDNLPNNDILSAPAPAIDSSETQLTRHTRRALAQLRTNKSPLLHQYLHKIDPVTHPSPLCPLCHEHVHNTSHLFGCSELVTPMSPLVLWSSPIEAAGLLARWGGRLGWPQEWV